MNDAQRYRQKAAECLEAAEKATTHRTRMSLAALADLWIRLAQQADRNSLSDLAYETPPRREHLQ
jgi:hypothetical protein